MSPSSMASSISFFRQRVSPVCLSSSCGGSSRSTTGPVLAGVSASVWGTGEALDRSEPLKSAPVANLRASFARALYIFQRKASFNTSLYVLPADSIRLSRTRVNTASSSPIKLKRYSAFDSQPARASAAGPVADSPPLNGHCSTNVIKRELKGPMSARSIDAFAHMASKSSKYLIGTLMNLAQQSSTKSKTSVEGTEPAAGSRLAMSASNASGDVLVWSIS